VGHIAGRGNLGQRVVERRQARAVDTHRDVVGAGAVIDGHDVGRGVGACALVLDQHTLEEAVLGLAGDEGPRIHIAQGPDLHLLICSDLHTYIELGS
jgi:hypothetical protein